MFDEIQFEKINRLPKYIFAEINDLKMAARREGEDIICRALLGKSLHEVYSNQRIDLAVERHTVELMKKEAIRHPGRKRRSPKTGFVET